MSDEAKFVLSQAFDWSRWPKLAAIFQHRPRVNVYWQELADFVVRASPFREIPADTAERDALKEQLRVAAEALTGIAEHVTDWTKGTDANMVVLQEIAERALARIASISKPGDPTP